MARRAGLRRRHGYLARRRRRRSEIVGWAKRSVPTNFGIEQRWWARRKRAFAHPTKTVVLRACGGFSTPRLFGSITSVSGILGPRMREDDTEYASAFSRHDAPEVCWNSYALGSQRTQGMPDARCTRDLMRNVHKKCAHEHTGQRRTSDIPCAMALRLIT